MANKKQYRSMDKKEKSINSHIDKAIGYSDKAHDELQIALNIALEGKGLSDLDEYVPPPTRKEIRKRERELKKKFPLDFTKFIELHRT